MLERDVEKKVCEYARNKGWLTYKFTSPARAAVPDRLFITVKGVVMFFEFKAPGKIPTPPQHREHERLRNHNVAVYVVDDVQKGIEIVNSYE
jgi:hypothetical protein